jgi:hypothetical protein
MKVGRRSAKTRLRNVRRRIKTNVVLVDENGINVNPHPISMGQVFSFAWVTFKQHWGLFTAILLTLFIAWVVLEIVVIAGQELGWALWVVAHLAFLFFFAGVEAGLLQIGLALYDGQKPTYPDIFRHLALGPVFLIGQFVYLVMLGVGLVLFVFPGIYLGVRYSLFGFSLLTGKVDLIHSFQQSAKLSRGRQSYLLVILVSLLALNGLGASLLGLGLLLTVPLSILTMTAIYRQLSALTE